MEDRRDEAETPSLVALGVSVVGVVSVHTLVRMMMPELVGVVN